MIPKISVGIPTYNRRDKLKKAIDSILSQDYDNIEIIVSDNASTDGTEELMRQYEPDSRIIYIRNKENLGPVANGKQVHLKATGEYCMILCDDDIVVGKTFFSKAIKLMEENKNIVFTHGISIREEEKTGRVSISPVNSVPITKGFDHYMRSVPVSENTGFFMIVRKSMLDESGILLYDTFFHDYWMFYALPLYGDVGFISDEVFGKYYIHSSSYTFREGHLGSFCNLVETEKYFFNIALQRFPEHVNEIKRSKNPTTHVFWVMKSFCDSYRQTHGSKNLLIALWKELGVKYPNIFIYIMFYYTTILISKVTNFINRKTLQFIRWILRYKS